MSLTYFIKSDKRGQYFVIFGKKVIIVVCHLPPLFGDYHLGLELVELGP